MDLSNFWDWANQNGGGITAVATVALVLATLATLWLAGADSRRRSRPMVSANFVFGPNSSSVVLFRLKNYGPSRAVEVDVRFTPPIKVDESTEVIRSRYANPIGVLNPGETYDNSWFIPNYSNSDGPTTNHYAHPDKVRVSVTYKRFWWLRYKDVTDLDIATHLHTSDPVSSTSMLGSVRKIADATEKIANRG